MEYVIPGFIYGLVTVIMLTIGIVQFRSKKPVTFYSGEKALDEKELTDVRAWNRSHGIMWMSYSAVILLTAVIGFTAKNNIVMLLCALGGPVLPFPLMVVCHHKFEKKYKRK